MANLRKEEDTMEQVLDGLGTVLYAMLGLLFVVGPGVLFWLVVVSVVVAVRWVAHGGPFQRVSHEGQAASSPSTIKG